MIVIDRREIKVENHFALDKNIINALKQGTLLERLRALFLFFKQLQVSLKIFWFAVFLSLFATVFSAFGYQLFIPFLAALISEDYNIQDKVIVLSAFLPSLNLAPMAQISLLFVSILLVWFFKNLCSYYSSLFGAVLAETLDCNLKKAIINRYFIFGKKFHDGRGVGFLNNVLSDFSSKIAEQVFIIQNFFKNIFGTLVYSLIMLGISWKLTGLTFLIAPLMLVLCQKIIKKLKQASTAYAKVLDVFICNTFDLLLSMPLIKNVGKEDYERSRFYSNATTFVETKYRINKYSCWVEPIKDMSVIILSLSVALCIVFVGVENHSPTIVSSYIVFFILLSLSFPGLSAFADLEIAFASISMEFDLLLDTLDLKPEWIVAEGKKNFPGLKNEIEFRNVSFAYGDIDFIKNLNFKIKKGQTVAIVGQAGAGKTTVTNLLLRHYEINGGGIYIDGVNINEFDVYSLRQCMSVISQTHYFMEASLRENLMYGISEAVDQQRLEQVMKITGLQEFVSRLPQSFETRVSARGGTLSGGEQQLLSIARAFLREADIYILDEPTNSLDARTFKKAQAAINKLIAGKTTLIIAHHLSTLRNADLVILMEEGQVLEMGGIKELLSTKGKFYDYWMEQQQECYLCKI